MTTEVRRCPWCAHALPHGTVLVFAGEPVELRGVVAVDRTAGTYSVDVRDFCVECDDPCVPPITAVCPPCAKQQHEQCTPDRVVFLRVGARCRCAARGCPEGGADAAAD